MKAEHYADIGQYLRDVRESLHVTIEQASQMLHIHAKYLHKLEKGDLTDMPAKVYVRGYIKNYAELLRLNPDEVLSGYDTLLDEKGHEFFVPENNLTHNMPSQGILLFCTAGLTAVFSYWYFTMHDHSDALVMPQDLPSGPMPADISDMPQEWKTCLNGDDLTCFRTLEYQYGIPAEAPAPVPIDVDAVKAATPPPAPETAVTAPSETAGRHKPRHRHHKMANPTEPSAPDAAPPSEDKVEPDALSKPEDATVPESPGSDSPIDGPKPN